MNAAMRIYATFGGWSRVLYRGQCTHCCRSVGQGTVALIDRIGDIVLCERCILWEDSW